MLIRTANQEDRDNFFAMWEGYIKEQGEMGWQVRAGNKTTGHFMGVFDAITLGRTTGFILLAHRNQELAGGLMWQGVDLPYDTTFGRVIVGWGIFTLPGHRRKGVARRLMERALQKSKAQGYDTYLSSYHDGNKGSKALLDGAGAVPFETSVAVPLRGVVK